MSKFTAPDFRPTEHAMPLLRETATTAAERARAEETVRIIGARHRATVAEVHRVLAALGLRPHGGRGWRCAGCDRPMARIARAGVVAHNAHGMCRRCCQLEVPA